MLTILLSLLSTPAYAVDTSGCSQLVTVTQEARTAAGARLRVTSSRAPRRDCWNARNATLAVQYTWRSERSVDAPQVSVWYRVNNQSGTSPASVFCVGPGRYGMDKRTDNLNEVECHASATLPFPAEGNVSVELAPVVNGDWDTSGFGQNTSFRF